MTLPLFHDGKLRLYLAAPSAQIERAKAVFAALSACPNVVVVSTWIDRLIATRAKHNAKSDRDVPPDVLKADLRQDLAEAGTCEVILKLCGIKSDGAATEWGHCLSRGEATGMPLLIASGDVGAFELLADEIFATDEEAIAHIRDLAAADEAARKESAASRSDGKG